MNAKANWPAILLAGFFIAVIIFVVSALRNSEKCDPGGYATDVRRPMYTKDGTEVMVFSWECVYEH
jgi:hypothetical protein